MGLVMGFATGLVIAPDFAAVRLFAVLVHLPDCHPAGFAVSSARFETGLVFVYGT